MTKDYFFQDKEFLKKTFLIAMPIALQNLITSMLNAVDTFMISGVGDAAVSGVGAANRLFFLFILFVFGTTSGAAILFSQYHGKKDDESIRKVIGITLMLTVFIGVVFSVLGYLIPSQLLQLITNEPAIIASGTPYLKTVALSYLFTSISMVFVFGLRSTHHVVMPVVISSISLLINTFLNYALIFGHFGFKPMGVEGAAIATVIARAFEMIVILTIIYGKNLPVAVSFSHMRHISRKFLANYIKVVSPVIGNEMLWSLGVTLYFIVYGRMGLNAYTSITITQSIEQIAFVMFFGIANAAAVLLGNIIGEGDYDKVRQYAKKFNHLNIAIAICIGIIVILVREPLGALFNLSDTIQNLVSLNLIVFAIYLPFKVYNLTTIVGIFRSGGDTVFSLIADLAGVWFVGVPLAFLSGILLHLPIYYVYAFVMVEEVVKAIMCMLRLRTGEWLKDVAYQEHH